MRPPLTLARTTGTLAVLATVALAAVAIALASGSVGVAFRDVAAALTGDAQAEGAAVVRDLRLPRALAAFAVGGLLAIAGALMQVLLRNALADPYVLGISGGASVGALGALMIGASALVGPSAFAGALLSTLVVFAIARSDTERAAWAPTRLLLTGIVIAAGWGAVIALLLALAPAAQVKGMVYWLLGDLSGASDPVAPLAVLGVTSGRGARDRARSQRALARHARCGGARRQRAPHRVRALRARRAGDRGCRDDGRQHRLRRTDRSACDAARARATTSGSCCQPVRSAAERCS